jgi:hypothetical protein
VIPPDVASRFDAVIGKAKASGNTEVYEKTVRLLMEAVSLYAPAEAVPGKVPDPITRARAREATAPENAERQADGLHKLRAGREQCTATRRDGQPCEAPAIPGGLVCKRHGGGAPQVKIAAQHRQLQMALWVASADFKAVRGTPDQFEALCKVTAAERDLEAYETKMRLLREVQTYVRGKRLAHVDGSEHGEDISED